MPYRYRTAATAEHDRAALYGLVFGNASASASAERDDEPERDEPERDRWEECDICGCAFIPDPDDPESTCTPCRNQDWHDENRYDSLED